MNALPNLDVICQRVADSYRHTYGDALQAVFLYGSYARGDFDEYSDVNFAAIVAGERLELQNKRHQLWDETNDLDLEYDVITSPKVIPLAEFEKYKDISAYYRNIQREGKRIG